jgi:6-phosphogluconate dehydrogenase
MTQANIGVVGLAVMGQTLARDLASREGRRESCRLQSL